MWPRRRRSLCMSGSVAGPGTEDRGRAVRTLIVDGYNVIRQTLPYRQLAEDDLDAARTALVSDVAAFAHAEWSATIVFDGHANPHSNGAPHEVSGVTVVFSPFGVDADVVIEARSRAARERGDETVVVTSDAQLQWTVMGGATTRMSAHEFGSELRDADAAWREHAPAGERSARLEDLIDPAVRERLSRWARGDQ
jgi:predicted RNA-binding protein with PIN domain